MIANPKRKNSKRTPGSEEYTQVLLEEMHSQFRAFGEGLELTNEHMGRLEKKADATFIEVGRLRVDMEFVKDELRLIRNELKEKVGRDEFKVLERRVSYLEKQPKIA